MLPEALKGFGYLVPSREWEEVLGMTWDSLVFPQQGTRDPADGAEADTRVTVMVGGALNPHVAAMREEELVETVRAS